MMRAVPYVFALTLPGARERLATLSPHVPYMFGFALDKHLKIIESGRSKLGSGRGLIFGFLTSRVTFETSRASSWDGGIREAGVAVRH